MIASIETLIRFQGPEWGWPLGFFLRAYVYFDIKVGAGNPVSGHLQSVSTTYMDDSQDPTVTLHHIHGILRPSRTHIRKDPWAGLPELTNKDGAFCHDSCPTQAWSASTMLDCLEDVHKLSAAR